jgi:hypothetical protein
VKSLRLRDTVLVNLQSLYTCTKVVRRVKSVCAYLSRRSKLQHPVCSPNLARSDYYSFPKLREFLGCRRVESDELKNDSNACLNGLAGEVQWEGVQTLVTGYDK